MIRYEILSDFFSKEAGVKAYGSQSMAAPLRRVLMRSAASAMRHAKPAEWHYGVGFDAKRAAAQHEAFQARAAAI